MSRAFRSGDLLWDLSKADVGRSGWTSQSEYERGRGSLASGGSDWHDAMVSSQCWREPEGAIRRGPGRLSVATIHQNRTASPTLAPRMGLPQDGPCPAH